MWGRVTMTTQPPYVEDVKLLIMSTVKSLYHIVINTKNREMTIPEESKRELYAYMYGIIKNTGSTLIRMNGISNHIHMLVDLSAQISLSQFMHDLKRSSSIWAKSHTELFPKFKGWGKEYYAFSCGIEQKEPIVEYIKNQEVHHGAENYDQEMSNVTANNGCAYYIYD